MAIVRAILSLCLALLLWTGEAQAGQLANRLTQFPAWEGKPPVQVAEGDLIYPDWMEGTWKVTSTLVDLVAPLAPEVVTPGFESNRRHLNNPVSFQVRFEAASPNNSYYSIWHFQPKIQNEKSKISRKIVADRVFNGLNIARAYLGDRAIKSVKLDPNSPNRQITSLTRDRQLVSVITGRASETPAPDNFVATEVAQQVFRQPPQIYFNTVETTTDYQRLDSSIEADQVTAVYLSPQDPDYFKAVERPVTLYRYKLELVPAQ